MKVIIDRIDGEFAVVELESGTNINVPIAILPPAAKEGDCILITIDTHETETRKERIENKMKDLFVD